MSADALLQDILSKLLFGGAICVAPPTKLQSLERLKIVKIAAGNTHAMCVDNKNNVWAFGSNEMTQFGLGKYEIIKNNVYLTRQTPQNEMKMKTGQQLHNNNSNENEDKNDENTRRAK